jgi:hypothetical protein
MVGNPKPTLRSFLDNRGVLPPVARLTRVFDRLIAASALHRSAWLDTQSCGEMGAEQGVQTCPHTVAHPRYAAVVLDCWAALTVTQLSGTSQACHLIALHIVYGTFVVF